MVASSSNVAGFRRYSCKGHVHAVATKCSNPHYVKAKTIDRIRVIYYTKAGFSYTNRFDLGCPALKGPNRKNEANLPEAGLCEHIIPAPLLKALDSVSHTRLSACLGARGILPLLLVPHCYR